MSDFNTHESTFNTVKWSRFQVGYIILETRMYLQSSLVHLHSVCVDLLSVTCRTMIFKLMHLQSHAFTVKLWYAATKHVNCDSLTVGFYLVSLTLISLLKSSETSICLHCMLYNAAQYKTTSSVSQLHASAFLSVTPMTMQQRCAYICTYEHLLRFTAALVALH